MSLLKSPLRLMRPALGLVLLAGCGDPIDAERAGGPDAGGSATVDAEPQAAVSFRGEELPVRAVRCTVAPVDGDRRVSVTFDLLIERPNGTRQYADLLVNERSSGPPSVELRLPTELGSEEGYDLWAARPADGVELSEAGASGRLQVEGDDRGARLPDPGLLDVEAPCPEWRD